MNKYLAEFQLMGELDYKNVCIRHEIEVDALSPTLADELEQSIDKFCTIVWDRCAGLSWERHGPPVLIIWIDKNKSFGEVIPHNDLDFVVDYMRSLPRRALNSRR